jgi:hypothetical protein
VARKIVVQVSCDRCGGEVESEAPVELSFRGVDFRTDLCRVHGAELSTALEPFLSVAERVEARRRPAPASRTGEGTTTVRRPTRRDPIQVAAIRNWARSNGYDISDRGRIPQEVENAYNNRGK